MTQTKTSWRVLVCLIIGAEIALGSLPDVFGQERMIPFPEEEEPDLEEEVDPRERSRIDLEYHVPVIEGVVTPLTEEDLFGDGSLDMDEPLYLDGGILVEEAESRYMTDMERDIAPETVRECGPESVVSPCGRVTWDPRAHPPLHTVYTARIPSLIRLDGPKDDVWWAPFVHCLVRDDFHRYRSASSPGVECNSMLQRHGERMEWLFGGVAEGAENALPGTYTGVIPLTVSGGGNRWYMDVPVTYTIKKRLTVCGFTRPDPIFDFGTHSQDAGDEKRQFLTIQFNTENLWGEGEDNLIYVSSGFTGDEFSVSGTSSPITSTGVQDVTIELVASGLSDLPVGQYSSSVAVYVTCP